MTTLFDPDRDVPEDLKKAPFLSVFVVHGILDQEVYDRYQSISDGQSLKPKEFGGEVLGFSKPVFKFLGPEEAHAVAVIRWPDFEAFKSLAGKESFIFITLLERYDFRLGHILRF